MDQAFPFVTGYTLICVHAILTHQPFIIIILMSFPANLRSWTLFHPECLVFFIDFTSTTVNYEISKAWLAEAEREDTSNHAVRHVLYM